MTRTIQLALVLFVVGCGGALKDPWEGHQAGNRWRECDVSGGVVGACASEAYTGPVIIKMNDQQFHQCPPEVGQPCNAGPFQGTAVIDDGGKIRSCNFVDGIPQQGCVDFTGKAVVER